MQIRNRICARRTKESMISFLVDHTVITFTSGRDKKTGVPSYIVSKFLPAADGTADPGSEDTVAARISNPMNEVDYGRREAQPNDKLHRILIFSVTLITSSRIDRKRNCLCRGRLGGTRR